MGEDIAIPVEDVLHQKSIWGFESLDAAKHFITGLLYTFSNKNEDAIRELGIAIDLEPTNPYPYSYLVLVMEYSGEPRDEIRAVIAKWVSSAKSFGIKGQVEKSEYALRVYSRPEMKTRFMRAK